MAKKPDPPKPISWNVYKIAIKAFGWARSRQRTAVEKAAAEFKVPATKLMAR